FGLTEGGRHAGKIEGTAEGGGRGPFGQAWRDRQERPEGRVEEHGEIHDREGASRPRFDQAQGQAGACVPLKQRLAGKRCRPLPSAANGSYIGGSVPTMDCRRISCRLKIWTRP